MNLRNLFCLLYSLIFFSEGLAQSHINFSHLTVDHGLSQSSVTCILQDSKGFMWFGTQDGLNKYDGYTFKIFKNDPTNPATLSNNFIFSIYETTGGLLYIETQGNILHRYNPFSESFQVVSKDSVSLLDARVNTVGALLQESSGIVWSGELGKGTGLIRTDIRTGQKTVFRHDPQNPSSLSNDKVYAVYRDRSGNLWIGTFEGLDRFDEESGKFFHYRNEADNPRSLPDNWIWSIYEDTRRNLWIGTVRAGLCRLDISAGTFIQHKNDPNDPTTVSDNFIFSIYEDQSGLIWVGTNLGGVSYFNPSTQVFEHYKNDPNDPRSLTDNNILSMIVDRKGFYWIGTSKGGLNRFDNRSKTFSHITYDPSKQSDLRSNSIQTLYEDRSGILWIGYYSSGLSAFDPEKNTFIHYIHDPADNGSLSDNRIYAIVEDKKSNLWIGTYGGGVNKIDGNTGKITHYKNIEDDSTSLSSNATWSLGFDNYENLWVGTWGGGVNILDPKSGTFTRLNHDPADSTSLIDDNVIRIFRDSNNNMWVGTSKGFSRYFYNSGTFKNYTEKDGLTNSFVYGILEDNHGNLWLSTNNGISKFDPSTATFRNYYAKDGLQGNEFNQTSYARDLKTNNLLFGGLNGFNIFNPDSIKDNTFVPPIEFTQYLRYNTDDAEGKPIIERGISERDSIFLTYKDNIISLEFAALSFFNNLENQYRYKLEGFNENWIQLGRNHSVTFTNLSPDEYTLRVIGSNNNGLWNKEGASLYIQVSPPWWRTNIAYTLYFIAFVSVLLSIRRFENQRREQKAQIREAALRIKATEAEKRALEIENERKTKELEEARELQISMLPKELPDLPDLEIAAFMRTATEVGGDYYDFIVLEDGTLKVAFGDATGHGLQAGTMVTLMKGFFTSDSRNFGLQDFMSHCTRVIKEIKLGRILMSFSYLQIRNKKLQITSAGMPPLYYHHNDTNELEEIIIQGTPLGAMRNAKYKSEEKVLKSGDTLLLLTDGLPEQMNSKNEMFDYPRVREQFLTSIDKDPNKIIENMVKAGDNWMNGTHQEDDITLVVIRVK